MTKKLYLFLIIFSVIFISCCGLFNNTATYEKTTRNFIETLLRDDYINAVQYFNIENETSDNIDTLIIEMTYLKKILKENFGENLDFSFVKSQKGSLDFSENATTVFIEFSNKDNIGMFEVIFDDISGKILNIRILNVYEKIPSMIYFWLFGLIALCVPAFNIFVILKIKKSDLEKKWIKYFIIALLNFPTIIFNAVHGFSISWLSFQFLLGISFSFTGYLGSSWAIGIPLGGIYWLWKLKKHERMEKLLNS
jgi:hypothetical protein